MLALTNAQLIDGPGREPIDDATVLIYKDRIFDAGIRVEYGESAELIDLRGLAWS